MKDRAPRSQLTHSRKRGAHYHVFSMGMGKNYIMQNNIQGYPQQHLLNVSLIPHTNIQVGEYQKTFTILRNIT